jgi:site-specific recombinase
MKLLSKPKSEVETPTLKVETFGGGSASLRSLNLIVDLVKKIRPDRSAKIEQAEQKFELVLQQLKNDKSLLFSLRRALLQLFLNTNIIPALTESGLVNSKGFIQELSAKLKYKILPPLQEQNDFLYVIQRVFYRRRDFIWVGGVNPDYWVAFFNMVGIQINLADQRIDKAINNALQILSYKLTALSYEKEITQCFENPEEQSFAYKEQNRLVNLWKEQEGNLNLPERKQLISALLEALHNCNQSITLLKGLRRFKGTSLSQTYTLIRMQQYINRMFILLDVLDEDNSFDTKRFVNYFSLVVKNENAKTSLREFLSDNLGMIAYQIAEHKGRRGRLFITTTSKEFKHIVKSAMGGGFIISFIGLIKNIIGNWAIAPFTLGFLNSLNYSAGFIAIEESKSTLATKQPAYTASALASSLDVNSEDDKADLKSVAVTLAKVSRSQIASFFGNLIVVFPLAFLLAWLYQLIFGAPVLSEVKAAALLKAQHPFESASLLYAAFTGFFLFISGLVSGFVENNLFYGKVAERIVNHPFLFRNWSLAKKERLARYIDGHAGAITGSLVLGFCLGMSGVIKNIFGIPFDIRHITIAASNVSIALFSLGKTVFISYLIVIFLGVLLIGLINFLVSFALAFFVALKSRGIKLRDYPELLGVIARYIKKHPKDFILPPKGGRQLYDL